MFYKNEGMVELSLEEMEQVSGGTGGHYPRCEEHDADWCDEMNHD